MKTNVQSLPGAFPLHEDKNFLSESEWVILKLLCRPIDSIVDNQAEELSQATGNQITTERCDELIRIVQIQSLPGLGSWIARLMAESGLSKDQVLHQASEDIVQRINQHFGYAICNPATQQALDKLQLQWKGAGINS